jgi:hypothetical protein
MLNINRIASLSSDLHAVPLEHFESSMIVISLLLVVDYVPVVDFVIDGLGVLDIAVLLQILGLISAEVGLEGGIIIVLNGLEFAIGVEAEDGAEGVVGEAEDGISVAEGEHSAVGREVGLVLNGSEEVDHEIDGEEEADEDEDHQNLIA